MWNSLRVRLLLSTILVVVIAVGVIALVAAQRTAGEFRRYVERRPPIDDRRLGYVLARFYEQNHGWAGVAGEVERLGQFAGQQVVLTDVTGAVIADSRGSLMGRRAEERWGQPRAVIQEDGAVLGAVYIDPLKRSFDPAAAFIQAVNRSLLFGALVAGLTAVISTLILSGRILRPAENLTAAAERMAHGDLNVRVPVESQDELGQLAEAFNTMASSLAQQEELRRAMVSDVAHELRTPLTNLRGYLEATRDGLVNADYALIDNLYEETMLLSRLVNDLHELAQADAGQLTLLRSPTPLAGLVEQAVTMLRQQTNDKQIALTADLPADLPLVDVDAERIGQVLRNLLNNAIAHTPDGGAIGVSARVQGGEVQVAVRDTGEGIAPEHLPHVFDRFYRADKSRARQTGGAGLGLAIVRQLVEAHGGTVSAESVAGQGSTFTFTLPIVR